MIGLRDAIMSYELAAYWDYQLGKTMVMSLIRTEKYGYVPHNLVMSRQARFCPAILGCVPEL